MGICFTREKDDYIQYDRRYVYCETCLAKIPFKQVYVMAHCLNKTHIFCSSTCYGLWVSDDEKKSKIIYCIKNLRMMFGRVITLNLFLYLFGMF